MTREKFIELVETLTDEQFMALIGGINQNTFEYGWDANLDSHELINECLRG